MAASFRRSSLLTLQKGLSSSAGAFRWHRVAVIGSGPSGFYTTKYLFKQGGPSVSVDMFERLPTPFGLVRFGVAPDHPEVKNVIKDFTEVAASPNFRFFGHVEIGDQQNRVAMSDLRQLYDAVVVCTGAQGERLLGIPGEDLPGVCGAPAFVKWYNSHPDHQDLDLPEPGEAAVVLGQGNVALDVARLLLRSPKELLATDMDRAAVAKISEWQRNGLRSVQVIGRRGFVQAAFTNAELRELLTCSDEVLAIIDPEDLTNSRNEASLEELAKSRMKTRSVDILEKMAANFAERHSTSKRLLWIRFLRAPAEVLGSRSQATWLRLHRTELQGPPGKQVAVKIPSATEEVKCGLIVRSVGFALTPIDGVPLDSTQRIPHTQGLVDAPAEGAGQGGLYVSGWAKRGPQGIIASNIVDAQETAARIVADLSSRPQSSSPPERVVNLLTSRGVQPVSFKDWQTLEREELKRGEQAGRPAEKLTDVAEMLRLLGRS